MNNVEWTFVADQLRRFRSRRTLWQLYFRYVGQALEVIVTCITEMCRTEAEEHRHRAAIAAFVFEKIAAMLWTHLKAEEDLKQFRVEQ